jgi:hypothetical protein
MPTHPTASHLPSMRTEWTVGLKSRIAMAVAMATVGLFLSATPAQAANTLVVSGTTQATSSAGSSIVVGDTFSYTYTLNLDSTSTGNKGFSGGFFDNAVTAFNLSAAPGNVGTWSPTGVNWVISPVKRLATISSSDQITLQVDATNAPSINSVPFFDLGITLDWDPSEVNIQSVLGTESLGTTLGTFSPDPTLANHYFELRNANYSSVGFTASATQNSSGSNSAAPAPQRFEHSLNTAGGVNCKLNLPSGTQGTWVQLPAANSCTAPVDRPGTTLLGWSTSSTFPVQVAREQVSKGWGVIDAVFNGQRMIFIPAGGFTQMSGDNNLHAIWG